MSLNLSVMQRLSRSHEKLLAVTAICCGIAVLHVTACGQAFPESPSLGRSADAPNEALARAQALARYGRFADAEREVRTYLAGHPGDSTAFFALGSVLQRENRPAESLAAYTEGAKGATPTPEDLRVVALDYVLLDDYPDAIKWLDRVVTAEPANAVAWYDLGRAEMMQQNFPQAEEALKRSLALLRKAGALNSPNSAEAVKAENNLGVTYEGEGRTQEALAAYGQAIEWQRASEHPSEQPLLNYGKLLIAQNRAAEAAAPLKEAVRIAPNDPKCHEQLARALEQPEAKERPDGETEEQAQAQMLEAVRLDPSNARLHFQLGLMYRRAGKMELAREQMAISSTLYGSHSTAVDH